MSDQMSKAAYDVRNASWWDLMERGMDAEDEGNVERAEALYRAADFLVPPAEEA